MDPYLWTWLARHAGECALGGLWAGTAVVQIVRRRWATAAVFGALAAVSAFGLGTHLVPLLVGRPIPNEPWGLELAAAAPFVALAALALLGRPSPGRFDLLTLSPLALAPHGPPAWGMSVILVGRGWLAVGAARRWLLAGLLVLAVATLADAGRPSLRAAAEGQGWSSDGAVHLVSAVTGGLEAAGWATVTGAMIRQLERSSAR